MTILTCLGDSITDCDHCFSTDSLGNGYVKMLSDRFKREGLDYQVRNYGTDGFTINRLLQRVQGDSDFTSDIITILIGINDIGMMMNTDRTSYQQQNMLVSFRDCYTKLITILTKLNLHIILMEPFLFSWPAFYKTWLPFRQEMAQMILQLSEQFQLPYLTLHEELNEQARRYGYSEITTDGIHLTEQGQRFLADRLYNLICCHSPSNQ